MPTVDSRPKIGEKRSSSQRAAASRNDLLCSIKYKNTLPDVPFDPKFLTYPFDPLRFIQYNPTSLERNYKHDVLAEVDLGVPIDLILPETYSIIDDNGMLDPADEALLEEEIAPQPESKRARQHAKNVSWLRRTEYISSELTKTHTSGESVETKVGYSVKKKLQGMDLYKDRASQIAAIEATFEAAKKPIIDHYSKPGVKAKQVLPLFPDFQLWRLPFAQVIFDTDPAVIGKNEATQIEEMSHAMIRGMMDENNEQFVAYFLPTRDTILKRKEDEEVSSLYRQEEEYEYRLTKEYNWNVKNKASKGYEETYFFVIRPGDGVFYNEIETRVRLNKRRTRAKSAMNSKLMVKHRDMTEDEIYAQEVRLTQLEPVVLEEEEEDDFEIGDATGSEREGQSSSEDEGKESPVPQVDETDKDDEFEKAFSSGEED